MVLITSSGLCRYEDDGESMDFTKGAGAVTTLNFTAAAGTGGSLVTKGPVQFTKSAASSDCLMTLQHDPIG